MHRLSLNRQLILIVESEVLLVRHLVRALEEDEKAQTANVTEPHSERGAERIRKFGWFAAVVNHRHREVAQGLSAPILFYGPETDVPEQAGAIVDALKELLAKHQDTPLQAASAGQP